MSKRKAEADIDGRSSKRQSLNEDIKQYFHPELFDPKTLQSYKTAYANSKPYKHGVIPSLIQPTLLRDVRSEITSHISFTPKETDIYKIHQSGDLANLDGLDDTSLQQLPSLVKLRDALYSNDFREYLSELTGAGKLSGSKTDMAVNVYTPGCHLLCHDDVIGSRRVSYILYLMDPEKGWKPEWGGALRLYPTVKRESEEGQQAVDVPEPDHSSSIPPAFSQLSFFAVQPGLSYHDVEEVYARKDTEPEEDDGGRVRMAISGWYHIPQKGEEGYQEGEEATQAEKSSLTQLKGRSDEFDQPQLLWLNPETNPAPPAPKEDGQEQDNENNEDDERNASELSQDDLAFLIRFMNPRYLIPETVMSLREQFEEDSSLRLALFLSNKHAAALRSHLQALELAPTSADWSVARPPHKHRYHFQTPAPLRADRTDPQLELLDLLLPSLSFRKWLSLITDLTLSEASILARRFRRGKDYQLATTYDEEDPQLEVCLGITPTDGWGGAGVVNADDDSQTGDSADADASETAIANGEATALASTPTEESDVGGYEAYMAADDDTEHYVSTTVKGSSSATGAGQRRSTKADPAVYQSADAEDDDDSVLFTQPASWNTLTVVLRDQGTMRFVKYVSRSAQGDRWDINGCWKVTGMRDTDSDEFGDG